MSKFSQWLKQDLPGQRHNAMFGGGFIRGYNLHHERKSIPTKGLTATVQDGMHVGNYISAKRVLAGGILFGPLGALIGGAARKNGNQVYVIIEQDDQIIGTLEAHAKKHREAHAFVQALTASANDPDNT